MQKKLNYSKTTADILYGPSNGWGAVGTTHQIRRGQAGSGSLSVKASHLKSRMDWGVTLTERQGAGAQ